MILKNQKGFTLPHIIMVLAVVGVISGVGFFVYSKNSGSNQANRQGADDAIAAAAVLPESLGDIKSLDEITAQVSTQLNDATIVGIELEQEDSGLVYKVKLSDGRVLFFDAKTGDATTGDDDGLEFESDEPIPAGFVAGITFEQARSTALDKRPGKTIKKIEFETEEGVQVYSVRFTDGGRVNVNATTGEVVRVREPEAGGSSSGGSSSDDDHEDDDSGSSSGGSSGSSGSSGSGSGSSHGDDEDSDDDHDDDSTISSPTSSPTPSQSGGTSSDIGEASAKTIANNRLPSRTIEEVEIETEEGVKIYSIRYTDDSRVDVRATDGAIVRVEE